MAGGVRIEMTPEALLRATEQGRREGLMRCAAIVERVSKASMREGGGRRRAASPPGTPPNVQTGALRASIASALHGDGAIVGPIERYGVVHEYGGRHHPARPFMRPALAQSNRDFPREFEGVIR